MAIDSALIGKWIETKYAKSNFFDQPQFKWSRRNVVFFLEIFCSTGKL